MFKFSEFMLYSGLYSLLLGVIYTIAGNDLIPEALVYGGISNILVGLILILIIKFAKRDNGE